MTRSLATDRSQYSSTKIFNLLTENIDKSPISKPSTFGNPKNLQIVIFFQNFNDFPHTLTITEKFRFTNKSPSKQKKTISRFDSYHSHDTIDKNSITIRHYSSIERKTTNDSLAIYMHRERSTYININE